MTSTLRIKNVQIDDFGDEFVCKLFSNGGLFEFDSKCAVLMKKETGKLFNLNQVFTVMFYDYCKAAAYFSCLCLEITTVENYGLGIVIALSILMVILATFAFVFRREILLFINNKSANHSYREMFGLH